VRLAPRDRAALRLFCFPYAGAGSAVYRDWASDFPESVDVCAIEPPGRFARHREPLPSELSGFVRSLDAAIDPYLDLPFAVFGYSLGALMAFEWLRLLRRRRGPEPKHLTVAAAKAPQLPLRLPAISAEPTPALIAELERRYGALEPAVKGDPEMLEIAVKIMRADLGMLEHYAYREEPRLACPILAVGGTADVSSFPTELEAWRLQTSRDFRATWLPGGHFFLRTSGSELRALVKRELAVVQALPGARAATVG
jgi:surfactin synthase thioesterase subunit